MTAPKIRPSGEEGSFTFAVLIWVLMAFTLMTLVIDGGMSISAKEQAADVADAIARNVANDVNIGTLRSTGEVELNNADGDCLEKDITRITDVSGLSSGTVSAPQDNCKVAGSSVTVTVSVVYSPLLWGSTVNTSATAYATAVTAPTN